MKKFSTIFVMLFTAIFIVLFDNISFFNNVVKVYPLNTDNAPFLISLGVILASVIVILISLFSSKYTLKPIVIGFLIISSLTNYFMVSYSIVIDHNMIRNSMQTDMQESVDLFSIQMLLYLLVLGILPSLLIYKIDINYKNIKNELLSKLIIIGSCIIVIVIMLFSFSKFYTSFFKEHKPLRYYTNPTYPIYSAGKYISSTFIKKVEFKHIGLDATIEENSSKKKLVILVVGETARADRFSLNGYERETNPLLKQENLINFSEFYSCGTSTADSVPCMFSPYTRAQFSYTKAVSTENALDLLKRTGKVSVLWRDNNSDSKGVALRVTYEDFKRRESCVGECRDEEMLVGLQDYIDKNNENSIFIVLHQMGNHGPAYYKRYPKEFEKFTPICKTNQLEQCTSAEINNAYDNVILYTDYFLAKTIKLLKENQKEFETAMIYMSDHGESLGEDNVYLHGMPYFIAPKAQIHIPALMWFGDGDMKERVGFNQLKDKSDKEYSHDNLFHSILGLMEVQTEVYDKSKDLFK